MILPRMILLSCRGHGFKLTHSGLEDLRADVPQRAVAPLAVVVGFDDFTHLGEAPEAIAMDALDLQAV